jgi:hypothetical protein
MIIGVCGFIGSGKDTVADYLINEHGFVRDSFAASVKDSLAAIFGWDRALLEGRTPESRVWRETVDTWWANRLCIPHLTPRWVMQHYATEVLRNHFHQDIWIASLQNRLRKLSGNVVITDCRFTNEIAAMQYMDATLVRVTRGVDPDWCNVARNTARGESVEMYYRSDVHSSEWEWLGADFDAVLDNTRDLQHLYSQINDLVRCRQVTKTDQV